MADGSDFTLFPITNARGDVVEVRLSNGNLYARYIYDSWGNIVSVRNPNGYEIADPNHYAHQNPFRYRGYYYDAESGLYYLQSRYYDPVTGRFVNPDSLVDTSDVLGFNMYAYCENNPVNDSDPTGDFVVRRWMVSLLLDMAFMAIPVIGGIFAPIKYAAKNMGLALVKTKFTGNIFKSVKWIISNVVKVASKIVNVVKKVPILKKFKFIKNLNANKIAGSLLGVAFFKTPTYKLLNLVVKNVDIVLSLGGFISGLLDYAFDKSVNNKIWEI